MSIDPDLINDLLRAGGSSKRLVDHAQAVEIIYAAQVKLTQTIKELDTKVDAYVALLRRHMKEEH